MLSDERSLGWRNSQAAIRTECRAVSRPYEKSEKERVWKLLSEAGLVDIALDEFPERIKEAKHVVMGRLSELLELAADIQERQSAAYSLATLKELETTLWPKRKTA
jgi:hypothetical protein